MHTIIHTYITHYIHIYTLHTNVLTHTHSTRAMVRKLPPPHVTAILLIELAKGMPRGIACIQKHGLQLAPPLSRLLQYPKGLPRQRQQQRMRSLSYRVCGVFILFMRCLDVRCVYVCYVVLSTNCAAVILCSRIYIWARGLP